MCNDSAIAASAKSCAEINEEVGCQVIRMVYAHDYNSYGFSQTDNTAEQQLTLEASFGFQLDALSFEKIAPP